MVRLLLQTLFKVVPHDVLLEIFSYLVAIEDDVQCTLTLVCQGWRQLVHQTSRLWIWVTFPRCSKSFEGRVDVALERNKRLPLILCLQLPVTTALPASSRALLGKRTVQALWIDIPASWDPNYLGERRLSETRAWWNLSPGLPMPREVYWTRDGGPVVYVESPSLHSTVGSDSGPDVARRATLVTSATIPQKSEDEARSWWRCIRLLPHLKRLDIELTSFLSEAIATSIQIPRVEELHIRDIRAIAGGLVLGAHHLLGPHIRRLELSGESPSVLRFLNRVNNRCEPQILCLTVATTKNRPSQFENTFPDQLLSCTASLEISFRYSASHDQNLARQLTAIIRRMPRESTCLLRTHHSPFDHIFLPLEPVECRISVECDESAFQISVPTEPSVYWPPLEHVKIALQHACDPIGRRLLSWTTAFTFTTSSHSKEGIDPINWPPTITSIDLNLSSFWFDSPVHGSSAEKDYLDDLSRTVFDSLTKIRCKASVAAKLLAHLTVPALEDLTIVAERQPEPETLAFQQLRDAFRLAQLDRLRYLRIESFLPWPIFLPLVQEQNARHGLTVQLPALPSREHVQAVIAALHGEYSSDAYGIRIRLEERQASSSGCKTCCSGGLVCTNATLDRCPRYTKRSVRLFTQYSEE